MAIMVRIPEGLEKRLEAIAKKHRRSKSFYVREAIASFVEDTEDYDEAIDILAEGNESVPYDEIRKELGLDN